MADFIQNTMITTLQKLVNRSPAEIEAEILTFARERRLTLLLPALYSEFHGPAMPRILDELRQIPYIHRIVLSLDRAGRPEFEDACRHFEGFPCQVRVIWQDSDEVQALYEALRSEGFFIGYPGKGRGVWFTLGYILAMNDTKVVALHDCDIVNYERNLLSRLVYPLVNPFLGFDFSKGYFARVDKKMYGRVMRLFVTPMILALKKIFGKLRFLEYLDSFRYVLSGEFAMMVDVASKTRFTPDWGLEIITLGEMYNNVTPSRICQVEVMDNYEHKHKEVASLGGGLTKMVKDITKALFRILSQDGLLFTDAVFRSLRVTYLSLAREAIFKYETLAMINGLTFDRHSEASAMEAFSEAMSEAFEEFMANPIGTPLLSAWQRITAALPEFGNRLVEVVEDHHRSMG